jgi:hypothetical protein
LTLDALQDVQENATRLVRHEGRGIPFFPIISGVVNSMLSAPSSVTAHSPWARRLTALYGACLVGLVLPVVLFMTWKPLNGYSGFWLHATVGRWIWQAGKVPDQTLYLWTASEPYVYHSWLAELLFYGITKVCDPPHLPYVVFAFTSFLVLLPFTLIVLVWRWSGRLTSWLVIPLLLTLEGISPRIETRPELFTGVFLCLLLTFLVAWSAASGPGPDGRFRRRDTLSLAGVLLLFVLWANLHAGVVLGLLVLAVTAVCDLLQDRFGPRSRVLALLTPLALAAVCINPYGLGYFQTYLRVTSFTFDCILEWRPVWKEPAVPTEVLLPVAGLALLALTAWVLNPNRRWAQLGWLLLLGALFVEARRNVLPFALTGLMVLAANARSLAPESLWQIVKRITGGRSGGEVPAYLRWLFRAGVLVWLVLEALPYSPNFLQTRRVVPIRLEEGVVRFLRENELRGRIFNDYENAGYLQWCLQGQPPLFIDMLDAYPDQVMRDYQGLVEQTARGRHLLDERQIEIVVLTTNRGAGQSLAALGAHLDANPQWVRVYASRDGVIWVRRSTEYEPIWRTRSESVSKVPFATLERYGDEDTVLQPALFEDYGDGGRKGTQDH